MIYRDLYKKIQSVISHYPIIGLIGPRQSGKTTMLKEMFPDYVYLNFEDVDFRQFASKDPRGLLQQFSGKVIFDEVQHVPELFSYLQSKVDAEGKMGEFILSGSQNFHLVEKITQTLAGRVAMFRLFPFTFQEMKKADWLGQELSVVMSKGFYPAIFKRSLDHDFYFANYLQTYVQRDISTLVNVQDTNAFKSFLKLCAFRAGQLLNFNELARDAGISHTTARNWLSTLETSFVLFTLPPFFENFGKRYIKSPKLYFYDTGLLAHLLGIRKGKVDPTHALWGQLFENMIVSEYIKQDAHETGMREFYFWRDSKGHEVDLLYQEGDELTLVEIKASKTVLSKMFDGLDYVENISTWKIKNKVLIYGGDQRQFRTDYKVIPWHELSL